MRDSHGFTKFSPRFLHVFTPFKAAYIIGQLLQRLGQAVLRSVEFAKEAVELRLERVTAVGILKHVPVGFGQELLG